MFLFFFSDVSNLNHLPKTTTTTVKLVALQQAAAGYALWKLCEGDDAIVYRSKVMEAEVPDLLRDALPFFQGIFDAETVGNCWTFLSQKGGIRND